MDVAWPPLITGPRIAPMETNARAVVVALLVVVSLASPTTSWSGQVRVKATASDRWDPDFRHVVPGTRVVWVNPARLDQRHNLTAYGGGWSKDVMLAPGGRTGKVFRRQGTFSYYCRLHGRVTDGSCEGMCGVIHVAR